MQDQNSRIKNQIITSIRRGRLVHAYAFTGGTAQQRTELGTWLCRTLFCEAEDKPCGECLPCRKFLHGNHEDFLIVKKPQDRESIVKDQILELTDRLMLKPFGSRYAVMIEDAQLMNAAAQNKLLKTLEEPASEAVIVLLADRREALLPTVLSRCVCFSLSDEASSFREEAAAEKLAGLILSGAEYYKKKAVLEDIIRDKDDSRTRAEDFLNALEARLMTLLKEEKTGNGKTSNEEVSRLSEAVKAVLEARRCIRQLHSVAYTLKQLCLRV
ncbi:MAG: hypothetical protein J5535_00165 [Firmicutes bacterium]|nr:hypothetical protein [Bacillota bacterium]